MATANEIRVRVDSWVCNAGHYHVRIKLPDGGSEERRYDAETVPEWLKEVCRDEAGRFAPCGGAASGAKPEHGVGKTHAQRAETAAARMKRAKEMIDAVRAHGKAPAADEIKALHDHLGTLTVAQLHDLRQSYGLKASGNKALLVSKIRFRLTQQGQAAAPRKEEEPDAVPKGTFGPSQATITNHPEMADQHAAAVLGPGKTGRDLISAAGVPNNATATIFKLAGAAKVNVTFEGSHKYKDPETGEMRNGTYRGNRTFTRHADGTTTIHNDYFRGEGMGLEMLGRQVENATLHGVSSIDTHAAGHFEGGADPNKSYGMFNGYYTWPRFGYDASLAGNARESAHPAYRRLPPDLKKAVDDAGGNVRGLMATDAGRKWWLRNGSDLDPARFDLRPGSYSQRALTQYLGSKGLLKK